MDDALVVRGAQRAADLQRDPARLLGRNRSFPQNALVQRPAAQQLHADQRPPLVLVQIEDAHDPGMLEGAGDGHLAAEPLAGRPVPREVRVQQLDRDLGVRAPVGRREHLCQPAGAEPPARLESSRKQHALWTRRAQQRPPRCNCVAVTQRPPRPWGAGAFL